MRACRLHLLSRIEHPFGESKKNRTEREYALHENPSVKLKKRIANKSGYKALRTLFPMATDGLGELNAVPTTQKSKRDADYEDRCLSIAAMRHGSKTSHHTTLGRVNTIADTVLPLRWKWRFVNKNAMAYALLMTFGTQLRLPIKRAAVKNSFEKVVKYAARQKASSGKEPLFGGYYNSRKDVLDIRALQTNVSRDVYEELDRAINGGNAFDRMESLETMPSWALEGVRQTPATPKLAVIGEYISTIISAFFELLGGWTISISSESAIPFLIRGVIRHAMKLELDLHTALPSSKKERALPRHIRRDIEALIDAFAKVLPYPIEMIKPVGRRFDVMCYYIAIEIRALIRRKGRVNSKDQPLDTPDGSKPAATPNDSTDPIELAMRQLTFTGVCEVSAMIRRLGGVRELLPSLSVLVKMLTFDTLCRIAEEKGRFTRDVSKMGAPQQRLNLLATLRKLRPSKKDIECVLRKVCPDVFDIIVCCLEQGTMNLFPVLSAEHLETHMIYMATRPAKIPVHYPIQIVPGKWSPSYESPYRHITANIITQRRSCAMSPQEIDSTGHMREFLNYIGSIPFRLDATSLHVQEEGLRQGFIFDRVPAAFGAYGGPKKASTLHHNQLNQRAWLKMILSNLRHSIGIKRFHVPHQMDFRGRIYPLPQMFSIASVRQFRSLLRFEQKLPLGASGFRWLKIHAANMFGLTKKSFAQRIEFANSHLEIIQRCARAPFNENFHFWGAGENALEFLAACQELNAAIESGCPESFHSDLPVQVDGSANGLQHYSAISRDSLGAAAVNMTSTVEPQDVYTHVLEEMKRRIRRDAAIGRGAAVTIQGDGHGANRNHLRRSTIKRAIMTQVYGVTSYGMRVMIANELRAQNIAHALWSDQDIQDLTRYIQLVLSDSLGVVFARTDEARSWLKNSAALAFALQTDEKRTSLRFTTPLGFTVVLPYTRQKKRLVYDYNEGVVSVPLQTNVPSTKCITSFSANFIHSLDATHLAMTALEMRDRGLQMTSVHDCYWCHAANMDTLSKVIRETFVELYSENDPLEALHRDWSLRYAAELKQAKLFFPKPPKKGSYELTNVMDAKYFFA